MSTRSWAALAIWFLTTGLGSAEEKTGVKRDANPLAPLARFIGEWEVHAQWSHGGELRARSTYHWGVSQKMVIGKTFVQDGKGGEYQRYETVLYWHPKKQQLLLLDVAFNGEVSETVIEAPDANTLKFGYVPFTPDQPAKVRQLITFTDNDTFVWKVEMQAQDGWKQLIDATWRRKTAK